MGGCCKAIRLQGIRITTRLSLGCLKYHAWDPKLTAFFLPTSPRCLNMLLCPGAKREERESLLGRVTCCLGRYLEQPHLLDPHLDFMMGIVMDRARELVLEREAELFGSPATSTSEDSSSLGSSSRTRPRPRIGEAFPFQVDGGAVGRAHRLYLVSCAVVYQLPLV